jgi:predicted transcriptional regulator
MENERDTTLIELAAGIVQSYVSNNQMQPDQVPEFLDQVHSRLSRLENGRDRAEAGEVEAALPEPPVKPRNSVRKADVVCLECGKSFKTLKRHLRAEHGLSEQEYKQRWGLPSDMKLVAKNYSARRSDMAKQIGLGARSKSENG